MATGETRSMLPATITDEEGPIEPTPADEKLKEKRKRGRINTGAYRNRQKEKEYALEKKVKELNDQLSQTKAENKKLKLEQNNETYKGTVGSEEKAVGSQQTDLMAEVFVQCYPESEKNGPSCSSMPSVAENQAKTIAKEDVKKWAVDVLAGLTKLLQDSNEPLLEFLEDVESCQRCILVLKCIICRNFKCGPFKGFAVQTLPKIVEIAVKSARNGLACSYSQFSSDMESCFAENPGCGKEECRRAKEELEKCKKELEEKNDMVNQLLHIFLSNDDAEAFWCPRTPQGNLENELHLFK